MYCNKEKRQPVADWIFVVKECMHGMEKPMAMDFGIAIFLIFIGYFYIDRDKY